MQTKTSYRVLKWTFILGAMASLGSACVVTSGDGDVDEPGDGGESGSSTTQAGKNSTTAGTGGTSSGGKGSGGSAGTTTTPAAGAGGEGEVYMAGLCDLDEPDVTKGISPTMFPSCAPAANDEGQDCKKCLKEDCCEAWQVCYGSEPHVACGWGPTDAALGQWDCLQNCFLDNESGATDPQELLETCSASCTNQCEADDGGILLVATAELIKCANKPATCQAECFPFE